MKLEQELLREHSKRQALKIAAWIGANKSRFRKLLALFLHGEHVTAQRAAWVVGICVEHVPALADPHLRAMINRMQQPGVHDAVKRNVLRILQSRKIPRNIQGRVASLCFDCLSSGDATIACKSYSMTILANIAEREPDLKRELMLIIEQRLPYESAGYRARAKKVMKPRLLQSIFFEVAVGEIRRPSELHGAKDCLKRPESRLTLHLETEGNQQVQSLPHGSSQEKRRQR